MAQLTSESTPASPTAALVLHQLLDEAVRRYPDHPAVLGNEGRCTYTELSARSHAIAHALVEFGVRRGQRVIVACGTAADIPAVVFGCSRVGAMFVIQQPDAPERLLLHTLEDARPTVVVTDCDRVRVLAERQGLTSIAPGAVHLPQEQGPLVGVEPVLGTDGACLIYTSGSTGMPKAVVSTHAQMCFAVHAIQQCLCYRSEDVVFCALPATFDYGLYQIFLCAAAGAALSLVDRSAAGHALAKALADTGATVLPAVPSMAVGLRRLLRRRPVELPQLRLITNTGAVMPPGVVRDLRAHIPGVRVQLMYGLTECKRATIMPPDGDLERPGSSGRALPGTEVSILDPAGQVLPAGEIGEITVRGPHVMAGYWNQPELTTARFPREHGLFPYLRTGDSGWLDSEGFLYFHSRDDDIYKQHGFRVSTIEVEAAAQEDPQVELAAVIPPQTAVDEATLVVVGPSSPDDVLTGLADRLERDKVPGRCLILEELPLTQSGKIARDRLAAVIAERSPDA